MGMKWRRKFLLWAFLVPLVASYQNCGDIGIQVAQQDAPSRSAFSELSAPTPLLIPDPPDLEMRAVFIVDMSASMATEYCGDDLDAPDTPPSGLSDYNCEDGGRGADPKNIRTRIIQHWISEIEAFLAEKGLPPSRLKVAVIPFSGPDANAHYFNSDSPRSLPSSAPLAYPFHFSQQFSFTQDMNKIRNVLQSYQLIQQHFTDIKVNNDELGLPQFPSANPTVLKQISSAVMENSNPKAAFERAKSLIQNELNSMAPDVKSRSRFEIVFLSDGLPKPGPRTLKSIARTVWNLRDKWRDIRGDKCNYNSGHLSAFESCINNSCGNRENARCEIYPEDYSISGLNCESLMTEELDAISRGQLSSNSDLWRGLRYPWAGSYGMTPWYYQQDFNSEIKKKSRCMDALYDTFFEVDLDHGAPVYRNDPPKSVFLELRSIYGDFVTNHPELLVQQIREIDQLFKQSSNLSAQRRFTFLRLENFDVRFKPEAQDIEPSNNWLILAQNLFGEQGRSAVLSESLTPPFSLFPGLTRAQAYRLSAFYAINLTSRVSEQGQLELDRDGDGLFDRLETQTDPMTIRSNHVCRDSIFIKFGGCRVQDCDPAVDRDQDGLNQCEEFTLGTSDFQVDSDSDQIPDLVEIFYDLSPSISDFNRDSNNDGLGNVQALRWGASAEAFVSDISEAEKVLTRFQARGTIQVPTVSGFPLTVPTYSIQVLQLPVLLTPTEATVPSEILLLVRVESVSNPEDSFFLSTRKSLPSSNSTSTQFPVSLSDFLPFPNGVSP